MKVELTSDSDASSPEHNAKRDKREKREKREKKHSGKDKKSRKKKTSGGDGSSSDGDEFKMDDEDDLMDTLRRQGSSNAIAANDSAQPVTSPLTGFARQESTMQTALRRMASRIQQQHVVVSLIHGGGQHGPGPQSGTLIKLLNRAGGFMFLSSAVGRTSTVEGHLHDDRDNGNIMLTPPDAPTLSRVNSSVSAFEDQQVAPYAAYMASAAVAPNDDPDTQRHLVQSLTIPGHAGVFIAFAAKAPTNPTLFLGASVPRVHNPFSPQPAPMPPSGSRPPSATLQPDVFFSAPFDPTVHCWKVIPSEGTWFFLQPAASPGFVIECAPPIVGKNGAVKPLQLKLVHFSGAPSQCFRSSTSKGVGQSTDSGSVSRFEETESSLVSDGIGEREALANAMRQHLAPTAIRPSSGTVAMAGMLSLNSTSSQLNGTNEHEHDLEQINGMLRDTSAARLQTWARSMVAKRELIGKVNEISMAINSRVWDERDQDRREVNEHLVRATAPHLRALASVRVLQQRQRHELGKHIIRAQAWVRRFNARLRLQSRVRRVEALAECRVFEETCEYEDMLATNAATLQRIGHGFIDRRGLAARRHALAALHRATAFALSARNVATRARRLRATLRIQRWSRVIAAGVAMLSRQRAVDEANTVRIEQERDAWLTCVRAEAAAVTITLQFVLAQSSAAKVQRLQTLRSLSNAAATVQPFIRACAARHLVDQRGYARRLDAKTKIQRFMQLMAQARRDTATRQFAIADTIDKRVQHEKLEELDVQRVEAHSLCEKVACLRLGFEARRSLFAMRAAWLYAKDLVARVMVGFVVRIAVAALRPTRKRFHRFPPSAATLAAAAAATAVHKRRREASYAFVEAVDAEGFARLKQLRPPSAQRARQLQRHPSQWSIDARSSASVGTSANVALPPPRAPVTAQDGSPVSAELPSTSLPPILPPGAAQPVRAVMAEYPFTVPSVVSSATHRTLHRRPTAAFLRGGSASPRRGSSSARRGSVADEIGVGIGGAASFEAPTEQRADNVLRNLRDVTATPTTAARDMAVEMCTVAMRRPAPPPTTVVANPDASGPIPMLFAPMDSFGYPSDTADVAALPLDVMPLLAVDSPLPSPRGPGRQTPATGPLDARRASLVDAADSSTMFSMLPALAGSPVPDMFGSTSGAASPHNAPAVINRLHTPRAQQRVGVPTPSSSSLVAGVASKLTPYHLAKYRSLRAVGPWTGFNPGVPASGRATVSSAKPQPGAPVTARALPPRPPSGKVGPRRPSVHAVASPTALQRRDSLAAGRSVGVHASPEPSPLPRPLMFGDVSLNAPTAAAPADAFDLSEDFDGVATVAVLPTLRPLAVTSTTLSASRATVERRLASQQYYKTHLTLVKRLNDEHRAFLQRLRTGGD
jgi:hypothetical protein